MSEEQIELFLSFIPGVDEITTRIHLLWHPQSTRDAINEYYNMQEDSDDVDVDETGDFNHEDTLPSQNPTQPPLLNEGTMNRCARLLVEENQSHIMPSVRIALEELKQNQKENAREENVRECPRQQERLA